MAYGSLTRLLSSAVLFASALLYSTASLPMTLAQESGIASVYAYSGEETANGETASPDSFTAAHRTLPFGTLVRVTNDLTGNWVVVRINDRGPFRRDRAIDVSPAAARQLNFSGLAPVELEVVKRE
jgi:rare lipoprotein A